MANYTAAQMTAGVLGEVLTGGTAYTFTIATPAYASQSVYFGAATLTIDSSTTTNSNLQGSSANKKVGSLWNGALLPLKNTPISCDSNQTATIFVEGAIRGSGAKLSLTSTGWNGVASSGTGKITQAFVTSLTGSNYISKDTITISQGDVQSLGFTNSDKPAIMDIFTDEINGEYLSSDFNGVFANFTSDVSQSNFISSSRGFDFNIKQVVGSGNGTFDFTPTTTIPVNSYLIKSTGHITLDISPA